MSTPPFITKTVDDNQNAVTALGSLYGGESLPHIIPAADKIVAVRQGDDLHLFYMDGEQVLLKDFFVEGTADEFELLSGDRIKRLNAEDTNGEEEILYVSADGSSGNNETLLQLTTDATPLYDVAQAEDGGQTDDTETETEVSSDDESGGISTPWIAGLGLAGVAGAALALSDDDSDSDDKAPVDRDGDDYLEGTATGGTLNVNSTERGKIEVSGDEDWFKTEFEIGYTYTIEINPSDDLDVKFQDEASTNPTYWQDLEGAGGTETRDFYVHRSGTMYVAVAGNSDSTGSYTISMTRKFGDHLSLQDTSQDNIPSKLAMSDVLQISNVSLFNDAVDASNGSSSHTILTPEATLLTVDTDITVVI